MIARDGEWCWYCGITFGDAGDRACTIDHVVPRSQGGSHELGNLRLACWHCNAGRNRLPDGGFERSAALVERRRYAYRTVMIASGRWLPKRAFHHVSIRWLGEHRWECDDCGLGSARGHRSPAGVPCAPWCDQPGAQWATWWGTGHDPPAGWPRAWSAADISAQSYPLAHAG
ncbi:MAG: hypothetical protein AMXMBFR46_25770 [Acidimicrobiia bacterium]